MIALARHGGSGHRPSVRPSGPVNREDRELQLAALCSLCEARRRGSAEAASVGEIDPLPQDD